MIHVHLTAAERIVAASAAVGSAAAMAVAPSLDWSIITAGVAGAIVSSTVSGAILLFINKRLNAVHAIAVETAHAVDGINKAALANMEAKGNAATQAAVDVGAAQTKAAHAEGHLEGVLKEQERGIQEQIRIKEATPATDPKK
jgi:hypothetical protein